ncbi:MAG TPA: PQQ-binding-like beta-propeller repeat protein [Acidimicrobiales bacterium]
MTIRTNRRGRVGGRNRVLGVGAAVSTAAWVISITVPGGVPTASALPSINQTWSVTLGDAGNPIAMSSPVVANLPGGPAAVVGDRAGHVYAYYLSGGAVPGWPFNTGGIPVDSPPSTSGGLVYFGAGNAATPFSGGTYAVNGSGGLVWHQIEHDPPTNNNQAHGVSAGISVAPNGVVAPSLGQNEDAYNATNGAEIGGFPWFQADTVFSTAAIADIEGNGQPQIVEGGASTAGIAYGQQYTNGGHIRILHPTGSAGFGQPNQGLFCEYNTNQDVISSPAVGQFLGGGANGAVAGTGNDARDINNSDNHTVIAIDKNCNRAWQTRLDGDTSSSPALADLFGNGGLEVVQGTDYNNGASGSVYALNGANGGVIWRTPVPGGVFGGAATADLFNQGYQDVIVGTTGGVVVLDGRTGAQVAVVEQGVGVQSTPLITRDPNGLIGITIAGYNGSNSGEIRHYEVAGSNGGLVTEKGAWPEFHHDPQLTGNAGTPPPVVQVPCNAPSGRATGYYETAGDGGLFNFGNLPYCGSTGNIVLNSPVVGMAMTPDGGGYWLVASDGGVFTFGDARFFGSHGGAPLNKPIVGMASTPDGNGYWLVASDGGIFTYGDAPFYGSTGAIRLNQPVVGMAADPLTGGYWMVASDGGIFNFNAPYEGSTGAIRLNRPMVGMSADPQTGGYWLVASDGGIFNFNAPYLGSTGAIRLNAPIIGMATDRSTNGYWLVASDGGVFNFNAPFYGSKGGTHLNRPMVGATGV